MTHPAAFDRTAASADDAFLTRLRAGDTVAFDEMVVAYYEPLLRLAVSYLGEREHGEEVVQDVLLNVWRQRADLAVPMGLRLYLYAATRNRSISRLRHRRIERRLDDRVAAGEDRLPFVPRPVAADERLRVAELDEAIRVAVDRLPARCREVFVLSRQHNMKHEEIGRVMDISVKTVQEQMGRALKSLRRALADWLE